MIRLYFPLICLTWKDHCENQFDHLSNWGYGSIFLLIWIILGKEDISISTKKLCPRRWNWNFSIPCLTARISLKMEWYRSSEGLNAPLLYPQILLLPSTSLKRAVAQYSSLASVCNIRLPGLGICKGGSFSVNFFQLLNCFSMNRIPFWRRFL